jgi:integrase
VVAPYRIFLENRRLAAGTINGRLAAVRRLACEATDAGLLSPELAAGIRRVKGVKKLGVRLGNWLTAEEARRFWQAPTENTLKGIRDRAILAISLGCGLRRRELADLEFRALAATRGTLGHCRSCRERRPHQDGTASRVAQDSHRCLDIVGRHLSWKAISLRLSQASTGAMA